MAQGGCQTEKMAQMGCRTEKMAQMEAKVAQIEAKVTQMDAKCPLIHSCTAPYYSLCTPLSTPWYTPLPYTTILGADTVPPRE